MVDAGINIVSETVIQKSTAQAKLDAAESAAIADNQILLSSNTAHQKVVIAGPLATAIEHAGKIGAAGPNDPNRDKWKAEAKAALDRATRIANRLPGKAKEAALQTIKSISGSISSE